MAEYRVHDQVGNIADKNLNKYLGKSAWPCPTCGRADRFMYVKCIRDGATDLECAHCDLIRVIPSGTEQFPDRH